MATSTYLDRVRNPDAPSHRILRLLHTHRVMTTDQVARATAVPERTARYRLDQLRTHQLVGSARPGREAGSSPAHWWLRPAGARLVAGVPMARRERAPSGLHLAHAAAITETWLVLSQGGPSIGVTLVGWWTDQDGWAEIGAGDAGRLTPDAVADVELATGPAAGEVVTIYIEIDRGTMTHSRLAEKVGRYLKAATSNGWRAEYGMCPPLLLLTTNAVRVETFIARAARIVGTQTRLAGGWRGEAAVDVAEAGRLYVAASPHVTRPAAALTAGWLLAPSTTGEDTAVVALADLLTDRATATVRADRWRAEADAAAAIRAEEARLAELLESGRRVRSASRRHRELVAALADTPAVDALLYLAELLGPGRIRVERPDLAAVILAAGDPGAQADIDALRTLLRAEHARVWTAQAGQLLAADAHQARDHPDLWAWARSIDEQRLLDPYDAAALAAAPTPHHRSRAKVEQIQLRHYRTQQAAGLTQRAAGLGVLARRRFDPAAVAAAGDVVDLLVCDTCAVRTPRGDDSYHHECQPEDVCPACHTGLLLDHGDRAQVPALDARLAAIADRRRRLQAAGPSNVDR